MRYLQFLFGVIIGFGIGVAAMVGYSQHGQTRTEYLFRRTADCRRLADQYQQRLTELTVEEESKTVDSVFYSPSLNSCIASLSGHWKNGEMVEAKDVLTGRDLYYMRCANPYCANGEAIKNYDRMMAFLEKMEHR